MNDYFYINDTQAKRIEDVLSYLYKNDQEELAQTVCDLMRMSENWYGRLQELKETLSKDPNFKEGAR